MAVSILTELEPEELFEYLQKIEAAAGRVKEEKWGARTLDIDILTYGNIKYKSETLTIPHPLMKERDFVMIPLREIMPDMPNLVREPDPKYGTVKIFHKKLNFHKNPLDKRRQIC